MPTDSFRDFAPEQLAALPGLRGRRMLGGHGLYLGEQHCQEVRHEQKT